MQPKSWREVVCIASGPSLTEQQVEQVKLWHTAAPGRGVIAVGATFLRAPFADMCYAVDLKFWRHYGPRVPASMLKVSHAKHLPDILVTNAQNVVNSGANAIALAVACDAVRILLIGYDCKLGQDGRKHWHDDHPPGMGNCANIKTWAERFRRIAEKHRAVDIINCTRSTALSCFPRGELEAELWLAKNTTRAATDISS